MTGQPTQSAATRRLLIGTPDECWPWLDRRGQPMSLDVRHRTRHDGTESETYVVVYRLAYGEVPRGRVVHHRCERPGCHNPRHLVALTRSGHALAHPWERPKGPRLTHCKRGHAYDEANTYVSRDGKRWCRACNRESHTRRRHA